MKQENEKEEQFDLVYDENAESHEQSTSVQSKQSNANLATLQENQKKFKLKRTQKSLLQLNPIPPQRRGSQSCVEQISVIPEESALLENSIIYTVYWYDEQLDHLHEINMKAKKNTTISEFINLVIEEFNVQNHYFHSPFGKDDSMLLELYVPKKKNKKPNEDYPAFSGNTLLGKTNITSFALKLQQKDKTCNFPINVAVQPQIRRQSQEFKNIQRPFWQKLFFCCNFDI